MAGFARPVPVVPLTRLSEGTDIVVECAPAAVLRELAEPALERGRTVMVLSGGALLDNMDLVDLASRHGGRIVVPTGALLGLDDVVAAAEDAIRSVTMITRKPPGGLIGAPYLEVNAIGLSEPKRVFAGSAREAARGFPANVNVAAALALAGIGPRPHDGRDLGRSGRDAQHPPHRGRGRSRPLHNADRKRAVRRKPPHRPLDGAIGYRCIEKTGEPARSRHLNSQRN
jgi:hypothetical protein